MIIQRIKGYDFTDLKTSGFDEYKHNTQCIILKLKTKKTPDDNRVLFEIPETIKISQRYIDSTDRSSLTGYEISECYLQNPDDNGFVPIIEVELYFESEHTNWKSMKLGIPTTLYDVTEKDLYVVYDGVYFNLVYNNEVVNYNLPYGKFKTPLTDNVNTDNEYVDYIEYSTDIKSVKEIVLTNKLNKNFNYYTPYGHNTFIGDVMNFYHKGVYHLLYMPDTHHHANRWGGGGHHFEHVITRDFINWEEVGPIWDIDSQWCSGGTGTMFFHNGKYYVSYGLHTARTLEADKIFKQELEAYYEKNKESMVISIDEILKRGKYPIGTSFAVSDDGINFKKSEIIGNIVENPSVYSINDKLIMFSGGKQWTSEAMDKPWKIICDNFPTCYDDSKMRNTDECPSYFEWNGIKYIIMGFTGFWHTEKNSDKYIDYASEGYDIYDGLLVPMATKTDDNRVIIAGWIGGIGWASCIVHRELVQLPNGHLGMKWLPECFPNIKHATSFDGNCCKLPEIKKDYYIEIKATQKNSRKFAVRFKDKENKMCELLLDFENKQLQFSTVDENETKDFCDPLLPIHKMNLDNKEGKYYGLNLKVDNVHFKTKDFAVANVDFGNETELRIILHYSKKMNSTVIDVEINKSRTILSNRVRFFPDSIIISKEDDCLLKSAELFSIE